MARARMLATDASIDPELNSLTLPALTLYLLTIPHLDRDGLIDANPVRLAALAAPLRPDIRDSAGAIINEWVEVGLVVRYPAARNQAVLYFKGFRKHNRFEYRKESPSSYPPPPGWLRTEHGIVPEDKEAAAALAARFHPENKYRKTLLDWAAADEPSRGVLEGSRSSREHFSPRTEQIRSDESGGGGVQDISLTHLGSGNGGDPRGGAPTRLVSALAELSDDDLRMAADGIGSTLGLTGEYNGWTRMLAGATRAELMLICAWGWKWSRQSADEMAAVRSYPALLASKLKSAAFPDGLTSWQIHEIRDQVEEAARLMSIPVEEL